MTGIYSFIKAPILHLLDISGQVVPGIDKAIALFYDEHAHNEFAYMTKAKNQNYQSEALFFNNNVFINELRTQNKHIAWLTAKNLPFETIDHSKSQLNIFDEYENTVLCLPFKNRFDDKYDLLFLYLNRNKANFGLANSDIPLSTNEKNILGKTLYNSFLNTYNQHINDSSVLKQMNARYKDVLEENKRLQNEIEHLKANYNYSQVSESKKVIEGINRTYHTNIHLGKQAIIKIQNFTGGFEELMQSVKMAAINALNLNFGITNTDIELSEFDIKFVELPKPTNIIEKKIPERFKKTILLLDKLETAAKKVIETNMKLTGENVGNACPIPISAPAISDALKNHQNKVLKIMSEYPERWPLIKTEFRPIKNILWNSNAG